MRTTEDQDPMPDAIRWRLRAELDRVRPLHSSPRYPAARRVGSWRLAPAGLAAGVVGLVALSAFAATGSPNPVVWSERIVTVIEPASTPQATPPSVASQTPSPREAVAPPPPTHHETPQAEPSEKPEASPTPEAHESPEPSGDGGGGSDDHGGASPSPSSGSGDH